MEQVAVVVASHGEFAKYALDSAEMIVGKQENCGVVSVTMDVTLADAVQKMQEVMASLDKTKGTVILVDLFGGTPSNVAGTIQLTEENVLVISGLNLPMLIQLLLNRDKNIDELATSLKEAYDMGFYNVSEVFRQKEEENECQVL